MAETKSKFGIPIAGAIEGSGIIMPKLKYRFRVNFQGLGAANRATEMTTNVQSVTRPSISVDEVEVHSYNSKVYMQGKHTWNTIDVTIRDDITNTVSKLVGQQVQRQINHYQQTTAAASNQFKFNMTMDVLDGTSAEPTETWELEGCFIQNVTYGDNDYAEASQQQIVLTIRFDNAVHAGEFFPTSTPSLNISDLA
jgi:hypothetical protein